MYKLGDEVWVARYGKERVRKTCPVCFGKLVVTLILGNGEECMLPCDYCGKGCDGPRGFVFEYDFVQKAERLKITGIETTEEGTEYRSGCLRLTELIAFQTESEALAKSAELKEEEENKQRTRAEYIKKDAKKTFSWNAGYHLRAARDFEQRIEYHKKMAAICKDRSKK